jgi:hypothetical protein
MQFTIQTLIQIIPMMLEMTQKVPFMERIKEMENFRLWKVGSLDPRKAVILTSILRMICIKQIAPIAVLTMIGQESFVRIATVQSNFAERVIVFLSLKGIVIFSSHI